MSLLHGKTVTIVGLGLIGGSLALALRPYPLRLVGVDVDEATRQAARRRGVVDTVAPSLADALAPGTDLLLLATPVQTTLTLLEQLSRLPARGYTVLDLGSTKAEICAALARLPAGISALGGHPMCGKETAGLAAAEATLFHDATFVLCRTPRTTPAAEALVLALLDAIGATPLFLEPAAHDALVALVSHLPYFVAAALIAEAAAAATGDELVWPVSASGFRDTARLAGSDPHMMRDIVLTNRPAILARLRAYRDRLDHTIALLEQGSPADLDAWLAARQLEHRRYREEK